MHCANCETQNRRGARFCAACGHPLPTESAEPAEGQGTDSPDRRETLLGTGLAEGAIALTRGKAATAEEDDAASALRHARDDVPRDPRAGAPSETDVDAQRDDGSHQQAAVDDVVETELSASAGLAKHEPPSAHSKQDAAPEEQRDDALQLAQADSATLEPLGIGALLLDRYEIVELTSSDGEGNLYVALDHGLCPVCGFDDNGPEDEYCADCGASLAAPPICEIWEQSATTETEGLSRFDNPQILWADDRRYVVLAASSDDPEIQTGSATGTTYRAPISMPDLRWAVRTHPGQVRELNEDTVDVHVYSAEGVGSYASRTLGLFIVADGVGGQEAGEVASRLAADTIWASLRETIWLPELQGEPVLPETMVARVEEAIHSANQVVYQQRTELGTDMGTTITLALIRGKTAVIANVGDSRTYRWNADGLQRLTQDHSLVQSLIDAGEVEAESAYTHPQRNVIYRSIGDRPRVEVDTAVHDLAPGDRLVLCSDGLWEMARDEGIEETLLREPDRNAAADALVHLANLAGGTDNISAIVVEIDG